MDLFAKQQLKVFLTCDLVGIRSVWNEGDSESGIALRE